MELRKKLKVQQVHRIPWNVMTLASTYLCYASLLEMMEFMVLCCRQKWLVLLYQVDKLTTTAYLENIHFSLLCCLCTRALAWVTKIYTEWTNSSHLCVMYVLIYRATNMPIPWTSWLYGWRWSFDLPCWVYWRVRYTLVFQVIINIIYLLNSFFLF